LDLWCQIQIRKMLKIWAAIKKHMWFLILHFFCRMGAQDTLSMKLLGDGRPNVFADQLLHKMYYTHKTWNNCYSQHKLIAKMPSTTLQCLRKV
jgi:hypothetical protein